MRELGEQLGVFFPEHREALVASEGAERVASYRELVQAACVRYGTEQVDRWGDAGRLLELCERRAAAGGLREAAAMGTAAGVMGGVLILMQVLEERRRQPGGEAALARLRTESRRIVHTCGHEAEHELAGTFREREGQAGQHGDEDCVACWLKSRPVMEVEKDDDRTCGGMIEGGSW